MRRSRIALLASLQLCRAKSHGFSIHSDLLAFPQYEVVFSEETISEKAAQALIEKNDAHPTYSADFAQPTGAEGHDASSTESNDQDLPHTYEMMKMSQHQYLCSIPVIQPPPPENETANELAKAAEDLERKRAAAHGWDLLSDLDETCLYFGSGWWTYSFCRNKEIVQYHALPAPPSADKPPKRDPRTAQFTLGREPAIPSANRKRVGGADGSKYEEQEKPLPAELQVTSDHQRYLVQKLERGDVCDLTGRERTIEVQYQCAPGSRGDKIGYLKEVTICAYLMVVYTPRLCDDVAFLPREEPKANPISCQLVLAEGETSKQPLLDDGVKEAEGAAAAEDVKADDKIEKVKEGEEADANTVKNQPINIGGVVVGARNVLSAGDEAGKPPTRIGPPTSYFPGGTGSKKSKKTPLVVARGASKEDGGKVETLTQAEIKALELDFQIIQEMREQLEKLSGEKGWKLEVVQEEGGQRELRGWIYDDDGDGVDGSGQYFDKDEYDDDDEVDGAAAATKKKKDDDGSEEKFKDEL